MADPYLRTPKDWVKTTLEARSDSHYITRVDSGGTPSTSIDEYWDGDIPWLTPKEITNLNDGLFVSRTERMISEEGLRNSAAKLMPVGTVMLSKRAPVGAVAVNAVPMSTNQGFLNFQCGKLLRPLYLAAWLRVNKPYLDKVANGSTYPELYVGDLFEFQISIPPLEIQDQIIRVINAIQFASLLGPPLEQTTVTADRMASLQDQNYRLERLRDAILPALLSGDLEVPALRSQPKRVTK